MAKIFSVPTGLRLAVLLAVASVLALTWATAAHAQTSGDDQYGSPSASGEDAILQSNLTGTDGGSGSGGASGGSGAAGASGEDLGSAGGAGAAGASGAAGVEGAAGGLEVLPLTGGSVLPVVVLGVFVLSAAGLVALRRTNR